MINDPAGHRHNHVVRQSPSQLFGDFKSHGLRAFRVIRTQIHIDEAPSVFVRDLRAQPIHLVVAARNANQLRAINLRAQNFCRLKICGNEDPRFESVARRLRRNRIGKIPGRRTRHRIEAEAPRLRQSHCDHAVFEAERGQTNGVILDEEMFGAKTRGQLGRAKQRRKADRQRCLIVRAAEAAVPRSATYRERGSRYAHA